jgi:hypothetical protein
MGHKLALTSLCGGSELLCGAALCVELGLLNLQQLPSKYCAGNVFRVWGSGIPSLNNTEGSCAGLYCSCTSGACDCVIVEAAAA